MFVKCLLKIAASRNDHIFAVLASPERFLLCRWVNGIPQPYVYRSAFLGLHATLKMVGFYHRNAVLLY